MGWFILIVLIVIIIVAFQNAKTDKKNNEIKDDAYILKKKATVNGKFHTSPYKNSYEFLNYMGKFFKNKKHEWTFVAFCSHRGVDRFWLNKGIDNSWVALTIDIDKIVNICRSENYSNLIVGHNHPAGILQPSKQDRLYLETQMDMLNNIDVNVEHYVFVAGNYKKYNLSFGQHIKRAFRKE